MFKVTNVEVHDYSHCLDHEGNPSTDFSADITINDKFMLQLGTDGEFSIPRSHECFASTEESQDEAYENVDARELVEYLELSNEREFIEAI